MARKWTVPDDDEFDRQFEQAVEAGRRSAAAEPRAVSACYDAASGRVVVELANGCLFGFPARLGEGLERATPEQLAAVRVTRSGHGLHWDALDVHHAVPALISGTFGSREWMRELGRAGGKVRSAAKAAAARINGMKGGRPRKAAG